MNILTEIGGCGCVCPWGAFFVFGRHFYFLAQAECFFTLDVHFETSFCCRFSVDYLFSIAHWGSVFSPLVIFHRMLPSHALANSATEEDASIGGGTPELPSAGVTVYRSDWPAPLVALRACRI